VKPNTTRIAKQNLVPSIVLGVRSQALLVESELGHFFLVISLKYFPEE
jgi:hypothetical protein